MTDQHSHWNNVHTEQGLAADADHETAFAVSVNHVLPAGSRILELGCGEGNDSLYFAEQGHQVTATDFSDVLIARNIEQRQHPNLHFAMQDTSQPLAFPDGSFDAVYARLSLHYFTDSVTRDVFTEIARALREGGVLGFMCKSVDDRLYGQGTLVEKDMYDKGGHVRHFFSEAYARELLAPLFEVQNITSGQDDLYGYPSAYITALAIRAS